MNSFVDASFGIHSDRKEHIGLIIFIPSIEIIVCNIKCSCRIIRIVWRRYENGHMVRENIQWLGIEVHPIIVYQDNGSAKYIVENRKIKSNRLQHIKVKYHYIQELVENKDIEIASVKTDDMWPTTLHLLVKCQFISILFHTKIWSIFAMIFPSSNHHFSHSIRHYELYCDHVVVVVV